VERPEDNTQTARALLLVAGALLGVVGMASDQPILIYIAMGVVAVGLMLAIVRRIKIRRSES
jgi:hypothetical protein